MAEHDHPASRAHRAADESCPSGQSITGMPWALAYPRTRRLNLVRFWARCVKRRHQEAKIYLAYERGLITKAEIDRMLKQVDEFDGSCLSVIAERERQWQQQHEDERRISPRDTALRTG